MKTKGKKMKMIKIGLLGIVFLFTASMAGAATIHIDPIAVTVDPGDLVQLSVKGNDFGPAGVTGGSITLNWDPDILTLNTTITDAGLDAFLNTGFTDIARFTSDPVAGQLDFSAFVGITALPQGVDPVTGLGIEFTFLNLVLTALAPPGTVLDVGLGPDGNWQLGDFSQVLPADVTYTGTTITVVNPVPVPGAVWLLGSGLLGLVGVVRRRGA